jgi:hypothetical protein
MVGSRVCGKLWKKIDTCNTGNRVQERGSAFSVKEARIYVLLQLQSN